MGKFFDNFRLQLVVSFMAESFSGSLGHGGVATFPDRPFLHWKVNFDKNRLGNGKVSDRDNPATFLYACEKMHSYFARFAKGHYADPTPVVEFSEISNIIDKILRFEGKMDDRIREWQKAIKNNSIYESVKEGESEIHYDVSEWENKKKTLLDMRSSKDWIDTDIYKFHQAAALHRCYVLKDLLPEHGITAY